MYRAGDHPRSRGVYSFAWKMALISEGSSPLARGLPHFTVSVLKGDGIIPARAGFTTKNFNLPIYLKDHPRSRGVYQMRYMMCLLSQGSSPLARGLLLARRQFDAIGRIIPARAGFTIIASTVDLELPDHPRSRGVYGPCVAFGAGVAGSSPLARGLLPARGGDEIPGRIIPARAGFTVQPRTEKVRGTDHPRSRGVYPLGLYVPRYCCGSSPLARGLQQNRKSTCLSGRIIPARAGFTHSSL